ncbi:hypothetical protein FACS189431_3440 [Alphaproteobacteria bacterium]|nr:hypothetical protein FACS189431_3440 [Alphaproteobacteria bacterium]
MKKNDKRTNDTENLDYEKDPRFIEYMKMLVEYSKNPDNLVDGRESMKRIRKELGLPFADVLLIRQSR